METILIYRLGSIGDTVVALPCFHKIASSFPNARRLALTNRPVSEKTTSLESILKGSGLIHDSITYELKERRCSEFARLRREIKSARIKLLIYLAQPRGRLQIFRDLAFFKWCGIRKIIGAPLTSDCYSLRRNSMTNEVEREAERLARCLTPLGPIDLSRLSSWDLVLTANEETCAHSVLRNWQGRQFAVISVGGKLESQNWGNNNWRRFIKLLSERTPELGLLFVGAAAESQRCAELASLWSGETKNCCGMLSPRESAAVMKFANVFVGHESGPMHLAASVGTRCVAMLGANNPPKKWHPIGLGHKILHDRTDILNIRPESVLAAVSDVLANPNVADDERDFMLTNCP